MTLQSTTQQLLSASRRLKQESVGYRQRLAARLRVQRSLGLRALACFTHGNRSWEQSIDLNDTLVEDVA